MSELRQRLSTCFATVFPDLSETEIPRASMASVGSWDSLATITLVTVLQEEFGIDFPPGDLDQLTSFELIHDYLEQHHAPVS